VLWAGMSEEFVALVNSLRAGHQVDLVPGSWLAYVAEGGSLRLPRVTRAPRDPVKGLRPTSLGRHGLPPDEHEATSWTSGTCPCAAPRPANDKGAIMSRTTEFQPRLQLSSCLGRRVPGLQSESLPARRVPLWHCAIAVQLGPLLRQPRQLDKHRWCHCAEEL
jgi:hypothetical protein